MDSDISVDHYDYLDDESMSTQKDPVPQLSEKLQKQMISATINESSREGEVKQQKCSTCNALVGDTKEYIEHFKSEWLKHNLRLKTRQLPSLTAEECMAGLELGDLFVLIRVLVQDEF